ncbi:MAG: helix-hairpin-helix domain-containing protein [Bacilli bacterium]|nr:helix-hairpin-helix domain-containing protein [Bacilli bacterium]
MTFKYRYRKQIILGVIIFIILGSVVGFLIYKNKDKFKSKKEDIVVEKKLVKKKDSFVEKIQVDIKGEINYPGIYKVDSNLRVMDVIKLAGDLTENADTSVINLSKKVSDEMVIIIYSKEEVLDFKKTKEIEKQVEERCVQKDENSLVNDACIECSTSNGKVNINTASIDELKNLSGIGEKKAKDIVSYREKNGNFNYIEDIMKVAGIGEANFAQIKEDITV